MGCYIKVGNLYVGPRAVLVNKREDAIYKHHPSECRKLIKSFFTKGIDGPFEIRTWSSDELIERMNHGS